jgi:hypothetical protein
MEVISAEFTTCKGTFLFPRLNTPETPPFDGYDGPPVYSCILRVKDEEAQPMLNYLEELYQENLAACRKEYGAKTTVEADRPWEPELDENENETGYMLIRTKRDSEVTRKRDGKTFTFKVHLFDAKGNPTNVEVGGGTVGKLRLEARGWYFGGKRKGAKGKAGLKLQIHAAQIIDLKQFSSGGDAGSYGFDEEDGFETDATKAGFSDESGDVEREEFDAGEEMENEAPAKKRTKPANGGNF